MKREADATAVLRRLLDRHERRSAARRIIERPAQSFSAVADQRALIETLTEAEEAGAVQLIWDRDAPHLIEQVVLTDPKRLYAFTHRAPVDTMLAAAVEKLCGVAVTTETARGLIDDIVTAWSAGKRLVRLGIDDVDAATLLVRATDAAFTELEADVPLRTRSTRLLGDSKALERAIPTMLAYLRQAGLIDQDLARDDALDRIGLATYAQPVLVAGPLSFKNTPVPDWPYIGVPPEEATRAGIDGPVRSILTIENLESFNRHVRTSRLPRDVVVYTGGFPSRAVLTLLRALVPCCAGGVHHWGDVDPGGIRIGWHLETVLSVPIRPHMMDVELARRFGSPPKAHQLAPTLPAHSAFFTLADYLKNDGALWLEQEMVDPQVVDTG